jgi:hypothetical protein
MIEPGIYEHFKGNRYRVIAEVVRDGSRERMVLYVPLYGDGELTVRPVTEFEETISKPGFIGKRFVKI